MGAGASDSVKAEISQIRSELDVKLTELERRLPPLVKAGRRAAVVAAGGGAGGSALYLALRIRRGRKAKAKAKAVPAEAPVAINVLPRGAVPVAIGVAAIWAGVRLYEASIRAREAGTDASAELRVLKDAAAAR